METVNKKEIDLEQVPTKVRVVHGREIRYILVNGYWIPALKYPEPEKEFHMDMWGSSHMEWLEENDPLRRVNLITTGTLPDYLTELQERAWNLMEYLTKRMAEQEGVTEELKRRDQMEWVGRMNNIQARARELVFHEVIYR